jgi:hypothetical protein
MKLEAVDRLTKSAQALSEMRKVVDMKDPNGPDNANHINQVMANTATKINEIVESIDIDAEAKAIADSAKSKTA